MKRWILPLLGAAVLGMGIYAYETAKPWVHPIKQADAARLANMTAADAEPPELAPAEGEEDSAPIVEWFGTAQAVEGDTIRINGTDLHLWAIDAPEMDQSCDLGGKPWRCGDFSRAELEKLIGGRTVACKVEASELPPTGPPVSCFVRTERCAGDAACETSLGSLNLAMVERGAAMDIEGHFAEAQDDAREQRRGLWASRFKPPWEWRGVEAGH